MKEILSFPTAEAAPERRDVLKYQGVPVDRPLSDVIEMLYARAAGDLAEWAAPVGVLSEVSIPDFAKVYHGEGDNEPRTPVGDIFQRAERLALFAVTLGERVSRR
ncbi:MAG: hypothetical protein V3V49_01410, partial [Candidatus Krumholzibacteria bacterium]